MVKDTKIKEKKQENQKKQKQGTKENKNIKKGNIKKELKEELKQKSNNYDLDDINRDMNIYTLLEKYPEAGEFLIQLGIGCIGCVFAQMETLEQGISAHGFDVDKVIDKLKEYIYEIRKEQQ